MNNAPLLLPLKNCGTLGVALRNKTKASRLINSIIFELCFYHSPEDLQFVVFYDNSTIIEDKSADNISYQKYKFSSHFRELFSDKTQFVFNKDYAKIMFDSLLGLLTKRKESKDDEKDDGFTNIVIIIYEDYGIKEHAIANFLPKAPIEGELYRNELGVTFIFYANARGLLPSYCGYTIEENKESTENEWQLIPRSDSNTKKNFSNVIMSGDEPTYDFYRCFRVLSEIYYTRIAQNAKVPSYVTLFKLFNIDKNDFSVEKSWASRNDITETLSVPVGRGEGETDIIKLDLHEKHDGCHMLVAGTTGSGKSETIISILIGLCLYYPPDELNLLLIDMKGGGFINRLGKDPYKLPHVVGTVTDVDGDENGTGAEYMLKRFLESLAAEIKRRKLLLNRMKVDNLDSYIKKHRNIEKGDIEISKTEFKTLAEIPSLAHLVFVVDEFTELKRAASESNDMDFISEITTIARVGRSLGFHIILISQNIEGAITDDIRVNSKSRLCLKVATKQASKEMLNNTLAASPDMPGNGRAYLMVGTGSRFEYFQSAYSGAEVETTEMPFEIIHAKHDGEYTVFFDSSKQKDKSKNSEVETQLSFVVKKIIEHFEYEVKNGKRNKPHTIFNTPLHNKIVFGERDSNGEVNAFKSSEKEGGWESFCIT